MTPIYVKIGQKPWKIYNRNDLPSFVAGYIEGCLRAYEKGKIKEEDVEYLFLSPETDTSLEDCDKKWKEIYREA